VKKYFGDSYRMDHIDPDQAIPVGGGLLGRYAHLKVIPDYQNMSAYFKNIDARYDAIMDKKATVIELMRTSRIDMDLELFARMLAIQQTLDAGKMLKSEFVVQNARTSLFQDSNPCNLSAILDNGGATSIEIALLSYGYLQARGTKSSFVHGIIADENQQLSKTNDSLYIRKHGKIYIFDVANPIVKDGVKLPNIAAAHESHVQEWSHSAETNSSLMKLANIITGAPVLYGAGRTGPGLEGAKIVDIPDIVPVTSGTQPRP